MEEKSRKENRRGQEDGSRQEQVSGLVPALRQGVMVLQMVFYMKLKGHLSEKYPDASPEEIRLLAGAVVNRYFGEQELSEPLKGFMEAQGTRVEEELSEVADRFEELRIPLTDALRMHFFLNRFEKTGDEEAEARALKDAKEWGILLEDRQVPWPRGFMEMAYRVGKAYGLIREQAPEEAE